jgi:hypothetical protein
MKRRGLGTAVGRRQANKDVVRIDLGVFDYDIEVALVAEKAQVPQFDFRIALGTAGIHRHQLVVGKRALRITVKHPHIGMGGSIVDVEINFLHVFAVRPLRSRHAKEPLLQDGVPPVPKRKGQTEPLLEIANSTDAILAPAIGARPSVIVREIIPGIAVGAVIFPHRSPGALRQIRPPQMPALVLVILSEAFLLGIHRPNPMLSSRAKSRDL